MHRCSRSRGCVAFSYHVQHRERGDHVRIEVIERDEDNLEHATRHGVSVGEIEQAISVTDRGRHVVVIAVHDPARRSLRPITAWEV
jgi:hypothetical protein